MQDGRLAKRLQAGDRVEVASIFKHFVFFDTPNDFRGHPCGQTGLGRRRLGVALGDEA